MLLGWPGIYTVTTIEYDSRWLRAPATILQAVIITYPSAPSLPSREVLSCPHGVRKIPFEKACVIRVWFCDRIEPSPRRLEAEENAGCPAIHHSSCRQNRPDRRDRRDPEGDNRLRFGAALPDGVDIAWRGGFGPDAESPLQPQDASCKTRWVITKHAEVRAQAKPSTGKPVAPLTF